MITLFDDEFMCNVVMPFDDTEESMLSFVSAHWDTFCNENIERDVSIALFCRDRFSQYREFCAIHYGFDVSL